MQARLPLWARCSACRPGQDHRNSREPGQLSLARNWSASLMVAHRKVCLRLRRQAAVLLPVHTLIPWWPSARTSALPPKTQKLWLRAIATAPSIESSRPGTGQFPWWPSARIAGGWHERPARLTVLVIAGAARTARLWPRLANRQRRQHTLCVRSLGGRCGSHLGHYFILIAPTLLTREPLLRGIKLRTMWRCLPCRCGAVTATAR